MLFAFLLQVKFLLQVNYITNFFLLNNILFSVPGAPINFEATSSASNKTQQLKTSWDKPRGGNAITCYNLQGKPDEDDAEIFETNITHSSNTSHYTYTITDLSPGMFYILKLRALNNAGIGKATSKKFPTGINSDVCVLIACSWFCCFPASHKQTLFILA